MQNFVRVSIATVIAGFPALAFAHPGHAHGAGGVAAGLVHPLTGADHLVAAVLVVVAIAVAARWTLRRPAWVMVAAAGMATLHAGMHALLPTVSAGFAVGVAASTIAIYAVATGTGLFAASRLHRTARA